MTLLRSMSKLVRIVERRRSTLHDGVGYPEAHLDDRIEYVAGVGTPYESLKYSYDCRIDCIHLVHQVFAHGGTHEDGLFGHPSQHPRDQLGYESFLAVDPAFGRFVVSPSRAARRARTSPSANLTGWLALV